MFPVPSPVTFCLSESGPHGERGSQPWAELSSVGWIGGSRGAGAPGVTKRGTSLGRLWSPSLPSLPTDEAMSCLSPPWQEQVSSSCWFTADMVQAGHQEPPVDPVLPLGGLGYLLALLTVCCETG